MRKNTADMFTIRRCNFVGNLFYLGLKPDDWHLQLSHGNGSKPRPYKSVGRAMDAAQKASIVFPKDSVSVMDAEGRVVQTFHNGKAHFTK